jgi:hypothetical protein
MRHPPEGPPHSGRQRCRTLSRASPDAFGPGVIERIHGPDEDVPIANLDDAAAICDVVAGALVIRPVAGELLNRPAGAPEPTIAYYSQQPAVGRTVPEAACGGPDRRTPQRRAASGLPASLFYHRDALPDLLVQVLPEAPDRGTSL